MSDTIALATEAITYEGSDAYHGATVEQLAEFLDTHTPLWEPATEDSAWTTLDGFGEALRSTMAAQS